MKSDARAWLDDDDDDKEYEEDDLDTVTSSFNSYEGDSSSLIYIVDDRAFGSRLLLLQRLQSRTQQPSSPPK